MKKIKLAIVRQFSKIDSGGSKIINYILKSLSKKKIELNLIVRKWSKDIPKNCKVHICNPISFGRKNREKNFLYCAKKIWKKKKINIIQSHERIPGCNIFRAGDGVHKEWINKLSKISSFYKNLFNKYFGYHKYIIKNEKKMFYSSKLKIIICNSKMIKNDILKHFSIKKNKLKIIYNSVDQNYFVPANIIKRYYIRNILNIPKKSDVLIHVGSGFARKGLYQSINAISYTNKYLIIVGKDKNENKYKSLAKSLGCFNRIRFIGISKNVLPYYHASDGLILPAIYDPFPNVILEAMSCELPVITSNNCGGSELIKNGKEGFVCDSFNIKKLIEYISLIPNKEKNSYMGIHAKSRIKNFTLYKSANKFLKIYKKITNI